MKRRILLPGHDGDGRIFEHRLRAREAPEPGERTNVIQIGDAPLIRAVVTDLTVRQDDEDENIVHIGGMMYRYDDVYDAGWFTESIAPGAVEDMDDVRFLIGHDRRSPALARSPKTMQLEEREGEGLAFEASLDLRNPDAQRAYYPIERGDTDGMSIGFYPLEETISRDPQGKEPTHYTITKMRLLEGSLVNWPAYESGKVEPREAEQERIQRRESERREREEAEARRQAEEARKQEEQAVRDAEAVEERLAALEQDVQIVNDRAEAA